MVSISFCLAKLLSCTTETHRLFQINCYSYLGREVSFFFIVVRFLILKISEDWDLVQYWNEDTFIDGFLRLRIVYHT